MALFMIFSLIQQNAEHTMHSGVIN